MQKPGQTRQKILKGALIAFSRHGIAGATTREIARIAKVNEVTLFRHFKTKQQLLSEVMSSYCDKYEPVFSAARLETAEDIRDTVTKFIFVSDQFMKEHEMLVRIVMGELTRQPALAKKLFGDSSQRKRDLILNYLSLGQERKIVRTDVNLKSALSLLQSMVLGYTLRRPLIEDQVPREEYLNHAVELFLKGILV